MVQRGGDFEVMRSRMQLTRKVTFINSESRSEKRNQSPDIAQAGRRAAREQPEQYLHASTQPCQSAMGRSSICLPFYALGCFEKTDELPA
jgi:hypothetical protein